MNQELKYIFETIFIVAMLFIAYRAFLLVQNLIIYVGYVLIVTVGMSIIIVASLVLYHGHQAFLSGGQVKRVSRRKKVD